LQLPVDPLDMAVDGTGADRKPFSDFFIMQIVWAHRENVFMHPHDLAVGKDGSLYVAQFASKNTYPIKLERI
jgi:hypothetical protein